MRSATPSFAVAAGDVAIHAERYTNLAKDAVIVPVSRSGSTSEIMLALESLKAKACESTVIGLSCVNHCKLSEYCSLSLEMPWCKVGSALTFAAREDLFALEMVERELPGSTADTCSRFRENLESAMVANDRYWVKHYHGSLQQQKFERAFSLSDRSRYYLSEKTVKKATETLCKNLESVAIPYALLHQYLPWQAERILQGKLENKPVAILENHIGDVNHFPAHAALRPAHGLRDAGLQSVERAACGGDRRVHLLGLWVSSESTNHQGHIPVAGRTDVQG